MKLAIIGSRTIKSIDLSQYISQSVTEIVSGGAIGVDSCAARYAEKMHIPLTVFRPDYARYGKGAPLKRNAQIAGYADADLVFWDGTSRGTAQAIQCFQRLCKPCTVIRLSSI